MAYVSIPKDLTVVKSKFLFGLTRRQTVCFSAAAATGLPLFFLLRGNIPTSAAAFLMVIVMLPWFLFAMYEKHGMPLEQFLKCIIAVKLKRPKIRTYQTDNYFSAAERKIQLQKEVQRIVSASKKDIRKTRRTG
jgi:hypothetical protein